jgi:LmbE family N-acetylglucosaminyl deacetylase
VVARAADLLGVRQVSFGGLGGDGRLLDQHPSRELVALIDRFLAQAPVDLLLTHHAGDVHVDHRAVAQACAYAARSAGGHPARRRLAFEVMSSTEQGGPFAPTSFAQVSEADLAAKARALAVYADELRDFPHPRSLDAVTALARFRGVHLGVPLAEAFVVERELW